MHKKEDIEAVIDYLIDGRLVEILSRGSGGKSSTKTWIYIKDNNKVGHTYNKNIAKDYDKVYGGFEIPFFTLTNEGDKISKPKQGIVADWLKKIGLCLEQAKQVINHYL